MAPTCESIALAHTAVPKTVTRRWTPFRTALFLSIGLRLFYSLLAAAFSPTLTLNKTLIGRSVTENLIQRDSHPWLYAIAGVWQRFDTIFYIHIARNGYDAPMPTVFYPLYPALIRLFTVLTRSELASAVLIASLATFFLFWGALRLLELDYSPRHAFRALVLWIVWPDAFIFFTGYPDSMLLALTVWSLYFARNRAWGAAGSSALFAGLTKALGCFTALPLLYIGWKQRDRRAIVAAVAAGVGTGAYQLWLHHAGFPSPSEIYATYWFTVTATPWSTPIEAIRSLAQDWDPLLFLNFGALTAVAVLSFMRRIPLEYRLYSLAAILLFLTKRTDHLFQSSIRYSLCVFAAYPALAQWIESDLCFVGTAGFLAALNLYLFRVYLDWSLVI